MPEYLAPGVYIEEIPSGNKPIEGVSTSTTGMVGVTARGPVNVPTLVTSFAQFLDNFGGFLDHRVYRNTVLDRLDALPYAADGFFANRGARLYVTRVVGSGATFASVDLYGLPVNGGAVGTLTASVTAQAVSLPLTLVENGTSVGINEAVLISDGSRSEYVTATEDQVGVANTALMQLTAPLRFGHASGEDVVAQDVTDGADLSDQLNGDMAAGDTSLPLDDFSGLSDDNIIRISDSRDDVMVTEFVTFEDAATGQLASPGLQFDHPQQTTQIHIVTVVDTVGGPSRTLAAATVVGDESAPVDDSTDLAPDTVVSIGADPTREFQIVQQATNDVTVAVSATTMNHGAGVSVIEQEPLLRVVARHPGVWGDSLRVRTRRNRIVETICDGGAANTDLMMTLGTTFGIGAGTVLEIRGNDGTTVRRRVDSVDADRNEVELAGTLGVDVDPGAAVSSVEFDLIVERIENGKVVEDEVFENLALDPEHSRYAPTIVGSGTGEGAAFTPDPSGQGQMVRVIDLTDEDGPLGIMAQQSTARRLSDPAEDLHRQADGGDDDLVNINALTFIGNAAIDPDDRTGIQSLENVDDISIVAVPGRHEQDVQSRLIQHCAKMRYRFAVLDAAPADTVATVQTHRQRYDTTYAALYHPWLTIGDRYGRPDDVLQIAPSGHVAGIYARTDVDRGVHKAPANEIVAGVRDLRVRLTKGEQDILNPKHINCLRDFRPLNRGLRVWGARTLSSDAEWKYVNVRRLFLFIEKSIERGTQFAVFEPNTEQLWATINRSVSNFLTAVWKSGALEGTSVEEAFFVKVDRTTMTQNDIDNGRLIILVGIAAAKPAEFVIFRISQKTRDATG